MGDHNHDVANSYCPSYDWDRYCDSQEMPEECPVCGKDNCGEDGEWLCKESPGFCSGDCAMLYAEEQRVIEAAEAAEYEHELKLIREHNDKCPKCKGQTLKYCFHQDA